MSTAAQDLKETLYGFYYNDMIEESAAALMSLHRSRKGAVAAMKRHKSEEKKKFKKLFRGHKFAQFERWDVHPIEVQP